MVSPPVRELRHPPSDRLWPVGKQRPDLPIFRRAQEPRHTSSPGRLGPGGRARMAVLASPDVGIRGRALLRKRRIVHLFGMAARSVVMSEAFGRVECKSPFGSPRSLRTIRLALISRTSRVHLFGMAARSVVMSEALGRVEWPFLSRKNPYLPTFGQKRQCPLQHEEDSVREPDQEIDVHDRPDKPRRKSGES